MLQNKLTIAVLAATGAATIFGQTQIDLKTQAKTIDFSLAPETKPVKTGTANPTTLSCTVGDMYFWTSAPAGANLYACVAVNTWALQSGAGGGGSLTVESNSTAVGTEPIDNYIAGPGILSMLSDTGTQINIQLSADPSVLLNRAQEQAGSDVSLSCASGNSTTYACSPNGNSLAAYTDQQRFAWKPDVSCAATPTINVSALGAEPLYRSDGSAIQAGDCTAGQQVTIWLDGTANVVATTTGTASSGSTALTVASATGIAAGQWVYGAGIANGTIVNSISGTNVILSAATTEALSSTSVSFTGGAFKLTNPVPGPVNLGLSTAVTGVLPAANGGTGVNNGANTLTLGGNLTTAGAFASTFTMTGTTAVTFPTAGTLMTTGTNLAIAQTPLTALGDMVYANSTPALTRLQGNTTAALNVLTQTGTGSASAAPAWQTPAAAGIAPFTFKSVTFSATPAFAYGSGETTFEITLTGNVTSSTVSGATAGQAATFIICQDSTGGRTFAWPTGFKHAMTIAATLSTCNLQRFLYDGTYYWAVTSGLTGQ